MKIYEIIPRVKVGEIRFNMTVDDLLELGYSHTEFDEQINWHTYAKNEDIECYVEQGKIVSISCWKGATYNGEPIIGLTSEELINILGKPDEIDEPVWVSDEAQQTPWQYEELCLQIWFENEYVVSVFCSNEDDELL